MSKKKTLSPLPELSFSFHWEGYHPFQTFLVKRSRGARTKPESLHIGKNFLRPMSFSPNLLDSGKNFLDVYNLHLWSSSQGVKDFFSKVRVFKDNTIICSTKK